MPYPVPLATLVASSLLANLLQPTLLAQLPPLVALAVALSGSALRARVRGARAQPAAGRRGGPDGGDRAARAFAQPPRPRSRAVRRHRLGGAAEPGADPGVEPRRLGGPAAARGAAGARRVRAVPVRLGRAGGRARGARRARARSSRGAPSPSRRSWRRSGCRPRSRIASTAASSTRARRPGRARARASACRASWARSSRRTCACRGAIRALKAVTLSGVIGPLLLLFLLGQGSSVGDRAAAALPGRLHRRARDGRVERAGARAAGTRPAVRLSGRPAGAARGQEPGPRRACARRCSSRCRSPRCSSPAR